MTKAITTAYSMEPMGMLSNMSTKVTSHNNETSSLSLDRGAEAKINVTANNSQINYPITYSDYLNHLIYPLFYKQ